MRKIIGISLVIVGLIAFSIILPISESVDFLRQNPFIPPFFMFAIPLLSVIFASFAILWGVALIFLEEKAQEAKK